MRAASRTRRRHDGPVARHRGLLGRRAAHRPDARSSATTRRSPSSCGWPRSKWELPAAGSAFIGSLPFMSDRVGRHPRSAIVLAHRDGGVSLRIRTMDQVLTVPASGAAAARAVTTEDQQSPGPLASMDPSRCVGPADFVNVSVENRSSTTFDLVARSQSGDLVSQLLEVAGSGSGSLASVGIPNWGVSKAEADSRLGAGAIDLIDPASCRVLATVEFPDYGSFVVTIDDRGAMSIADGPLPTEPSLPKKGVACLPGGTPLPARFTRGLLSAHQGLECPSGTEASLAALKAGPMLYRETTCSCRSPGRTAQCASASSDSGGWARTWSAACSATGTRSSPTTGRREDREIAGEGAIASFSIAELVAKLEKPRAVWIMVPAGDATEAQIDELLEHLEPGDTIIDGGNTNFHDDVRPARGAQEEGHRLRRRRDVGRDLGPPGRLLPDGRRRRARRSTRSCRCSRRSPLRRLHARRRSGLRALREDGPQRHRVRADAGLRRRLRDHARRATTSSTSGRSPTCGCRARSSARGCSSWPPGRSRRTARTSSTSRAASHSGEGRWTVQEAIDHDVRPRSSPSRC